MKRKEKRRIRVENKVNEVVNAYKEGSAQNDPMGQYTGNTAETLEKIEQAENGGKIYINAQNISSLIEKPVQDADDL